MTSCYSGYEISSENSFISCVLSEQDWWCNIKRFLIYSKNYICKFMQAKLWHKLFHLNLSFWICKVWKGREKVTKMWISQSFLDEIKNIFHSFWRCIIWWKKIMDTSFNSVANSGWSSVIADHLGLFVGQNRCRSFKMTEHN